MITLFEAIGAANCNCPVGDAPPGDPPGVATDSIRFDASLAGGTIRLARSSTPFLVAEDVIIIGLGKDQLTIDGDVNEDGTGNSRLFEINAGGELVISDSSVADNMAEYGGGGYACNDALAVPTNAIFQRNKAAADGGAWHSYWSRPVQMTGCTFAENQAEVYGGAAFGLDSAEIRETRFERNTAGNAGGAIYSGGTLHVSDSTFDANEAWTGGALNTWGDNTHESVVFTHNKGTYGGAINHAAQPLIIGQSLFEDNSASIDGGAVRNNAPSTFLNTTFRSNQSSGWGGAIHAYEDFYVTTIQGGLLEHNEAGRDGGAIWTNQRRLEIAATTIQDNSTHDNGGGIYVAEGLLGLTDSIISQNVAENGRGGGIWVQQAAELALANTTVSGNAAGADGGGIYFNDNANLATLVNATISNNRAARNDAAGKLGGGIYNLAGNVLLRNTIVAGNVCGSGSTASDIQGLVDPASTHNLIGDATTAGGLIHGVNANLVGGDPLLGPLADNGGQSRTHALSADSPATANADENDWPSLVEGVQKIASLGSSGPLYDMSGDWMPIVGGDEDTSFPSTVVLARGYGNGRVVAFGEGGFFGKEPPLDTGRSLENVTKWLDRDGNRQVRFTTGHGECVHGARLEGLASRLSSEGYTFGALPGVITEDALDGISVLIVGNVWQDFTSDEIEATRQFVESGGGLCLLGLGWS